MHTASTSSSNGPTFSPLARPCISGDHGPHFWCWDTLAYQSTAFRKYGLKIHVVDLCSYHAYNRCDGHGALVKKACRAEQLRGAGPTTPAMFVNMVNDMPAAELNGIRVRNSDSTCMFLIFVLSGGGFRRLEPCGSPRPYPAQARSARWRRQVDGQCSALRDRILCCMELCFVVCRWSSSTK